ncbi:hypothetical protein F4811DRAFT_502066 [Daldinia bambusicola]|nr:hypothetical protein F4811DRAFT_502066 [Daldinia bambusicola]
MMFVLLCAWVYVYGENWGGYRLAANISLARSRGIQGGVMEFNTMSVYVKIYYYTLDVRIIHIRGQMRARKICTWQ